MENLKNPLKSLSNIDRLFIELEILGENKMSELKLYTFFCAEDQEINTPIIEVIIDRSLNIILVVLALMLFLTV
ncbi:hypothetical protein PS357_16535 [Acinetobacter nosocomialis]|uniref:hypothetical protein n=1 Tax=Acinetobacter nosocomialis TaxID=106654 RepID=UPI000D0BD34A|nr:hypothetical protein [Acinetobacter nosocomialis]MDC9817321.1 hypothetical protein [Acinetobacter nosocomialis]MDE1704477.1 hypothetical protein [Acinetobacter nosocomialis]MDE9406569.1 hypothetical protein [Acinetobacter nosocomialis]PSE43708.1 hypothetical protein C7G97_12770 [Acinetobacter nosocomialis]PSE84983.1 hypothetical protein C7G91_06185 [Acinetobacter nosocomialis]